MELNDDIEYWDAIYRNSNIKLPWIESEIPFELLDSFYSMLHEPKRILDFACGNGRLSKVLLTKKCSITCVDISKHAIELCKINLNNPNVKYIVSNKVPNTDFNGIISWGLFHHIHPTNWGFYLQSFYKNLNMNGVVLISGFDFNDLSFKQETRISPTTKKKTFALDTKILSENYIKIGFDLIKNGIYQFKDGITHNTRTFNFLILKK